MKKRVFRFYWLLLTSQERWLNKMSDEGYRLLKTTTAHYEFEECEKRKYRYRVEYIANRSKESAEEYVKALEGCGYRVLFKNLNMDYSAGKVEYRPWAEEGGRIATEKMGSGGFSGCGFTGNSRKEHCVGCVGSVTVGVDNSVSFGNREVKEG